MRSKSVFPPGAHLPNGPFKFWQILALFVPYSLPFLWIVISLTRAATVPPLLSWIGILLLALLVTIWISGLVKGFPVWALPSLGLIFFIFAYGLYLISQAGTLIVLSPLWNSFWPDTISIRLLMYAGFNLIYVGIAAMIVTILLALSPALLQLARKDWSLLSFFVYTLTLPYVIMNDEFQGLEPYQLISILILTTGAGFFILLPARRARLLVLLAAALLALPTISLGLYQIFPAQEFASPDLSFRMWEAIQPVLDLPALLILLCLPWLVPRLPASIGSKRPAPAA